jgi:hypothetical protein
LLMAMTAAHVTSVLKTLLCFPAGFSGCTFASSATRYICLPILCPRRIFICSI